MYNRSGVHAIEQNLDDFKDERASALLTGLIFQIKEVHRGKQARRAIVERFVLDIRRNGGCLPLGKVAIMLAQAPSQFPRGNEGLRVFPARARAAGDPEHKFRILENPERQGGLYILYICI